LTNAFLGYTSFDRNLLLLYQGYNTLSPSSVPYR
jgi:hypothetical protein